MTGRGHDDGDHRGPYALIVDLVRSSLLHPAGRSGRLLRALLVVIALSIAVVLPSVTASRPSFIARYPDLSAHYASWSRSTHAEVACRSCHVSPGLLSQSTYRLKMLAAFYASILSPQGGPTVFGEPGREACESCHRDFRQASTSGDLRIPHQAHVEILGLECVRCHSYLVHEKNAEGTNAPRMATCLECHDGRQAKADCSACHELKDAPDSHRSRDWLVVHPERQGEGDCEGCHAWTPDWCSDCHSLRPASHAGRWRTNHPQAVERHRNCEACHRAGFCIECHGELPQLNFDPRLEYVE